MPDDAGAQSLVRCDPRDTQPSAERSRPGACCDLAGSLEAAGIRDLIAEHLALARGAPRRRRRKLHGTARNACGTSRSAELRQCRGLLWMSNDGNTDSGQAGLDERRERHAAACSFLLGGLVVASIQRHAATGLFLGHIPRLRRGSDTTSSSTRSERHLGERVGDRAVLPNGRRRILLEPCPHGTPIVAPQPTPPSIPVGFPRHPVRSFRSLQSTLSRALTAP